LYPLLEQWLDALGLAPHRTGRRALAYLLTALLSAQSLQPTRLMRALLSPLAVPARQRYTRVQRLLASSWLSPAWLTPYLVRGALALQPDPARTVALDSVRTGAWDSFTLGLCGHGRVQLLAWTVLPFPWPKGGVRAAVRELLLRLAAAWPAEGPRPHLVADRLFASQALLRLLRQWCWGYTLRLRATHTVTVAGTVWRVRDLLATLPANGWTMLDGSYGQGQDALPGHLVIGRGLPVLPWHQRDSGSARARQRRQRARAHNAGYARKDRPTAAAATDAWVVLFTTATTVVGALRRYQPRYGTEGTYRDLQSGWDGRHGWDLEPVAARQACADQVAALLSLCAVGQLVQQWVGSQIGHPHSRGPVRWLAHAWTVHGRLSVFARGRLLFETRDDQLAGWLTATLQQGTALLAAAPAVRRATTRPVRPATPKRAAPVAVPAAQAA
jgi:hypothetical protein